MLKNWTELMLPWFIDKSVIIKFCHIVGELITSSHNTLNMKCVNHEHITAFGSHHTLKHHINRLKCSKWGYNQALLFFPESANWSNYNYLHIFCCGSGEAEKCCSLFQECLNNWFVIKVSSHPLGELLLTMIPLSLHPSSGQNLTLSYTFGCAKVMIFQSASATQSSFYLILRLWEFLS